MSRLEVEYQVRCEAGEAEERARQIAFEQTVELPPALVTDREILDEVVGDVLSVESDSGDPGRFRIRIGYDPGLAAGQLPQLLNLVYGNVSMLPGIRLRAMDLPPELLAAFEGPVHGVEGLRELTGVRGRPLLATAIKPRGLPLEEMARLAADFAAGGGDIVKDDQNLNDRSFEDFERRVRLCAEAVAKQNARGAHCLYFPHVAAPADELPRRVELVASLGLKGVLAAPFLLGPATIGALTRRHGLVLMAHPALTGSYTTPTDSGIEPGLLLGTVFRLAGCDLSIFPNFGGRFSPSRDDCLSVADALRATLGDLRPAWPAPAGGMDLDRVPSMIADYGLDTVLLIGGALLGHGTDLRDSTRHFVDRIQEAQSRRTS